MALTRRGAAGATPSAAKCESNRAVWGAETEPFMARTATAATSNGHKAKAVITKPGKTEPPAGEIQISRIDAETIRVPIIGTTPLIVHRFSEKAKRKMLDEMQGRKTPKEPKDPQAEYEAAFYRLEDGSYGFPSLGFKDATVGAARFFGKQVTMRGLRQFIFLHGAVGSDGRTLTRIEGEAQMREDVVRVGQGGTDLRYRPEFREWGAILQVTYVTISITRDSVLSLIDAGGMGIGVGEWRPEKGGDFGTYRIDQDREVEVVR